MKKQMILLIVALAVGVMAGVVNAQVAEPPLSYTGLIEENFDSIGATGTEMPVGWIAGGCPSDAGEEADPPGEYYNDTTLEVDDGSNAGRGQTYNYGTTGDPDRAIGQMPTSGSNDRGIQVALRNDTGAPITRITITYTGEQWNDNQGTPTNYSLGLDQEKLKVYISDAFDFSGIVEDLGIDFFFPRVQNAGGGLTALDGNDPANRTENIGGEYILGTPIAAGATFYISWHDWENNATADHALAIDDVVIGVVGAELVAPINWALTSLALLEWLRPAPALAGDPGTVLVDVYFGSIDPNLIPGTHGSQKIETSYDGDSSGSFGKPLTANTRYYWRVDVIDPNYGFPVTIKGPTWSFITTVPAEVMISKTALEVSEEGPTSDVYNVALSKAPAQPVTITPGPAPLSVVVGSTATSDNSEETISSGVIDGLGSSDLEFGWEGSATDRKLVGLRFNDIDIPQGATISNAYMRFNHDEDAPGVCNLIIFGELSLNAITFTTTNSDISNRSRTTTTVPWTDVEIWSGDNNYNTPNIGSIISEIVGQGGWVAGNSLVLMIEPDTSCPGKRVAESSEHTSKYPRLHIEYVPTSFQATWSPPSVTLDAGNYLAGLDITVTAVDDTIVETDPHSTTLVNAVSSGDAEWDAVTADDVVVSILENECGPWGHVPIVDLNSDCVVDLVDLAMFASEFGLCTDPHFPASCVDVR